MNKRIILSLGLAALLSSSLLAGNMSCDREGKGFNKSHKMSHNSHRGSRFMPLVMQLDLSDEQRKKIDAIMHKRMKDIPNMSDAFSDNAFDKELFVKLQNAKREHKAEKRAQMIESIYAILNTSQKKELKKMLDEKAKMKAEGFKSCHKRA